MSRNTRMTAAAGRDEPPLRTRTAAPSRPTRATAKAPDETAPTAPSAPARPTRVARARAAVKPAGSATADSATTIRLPAISKATSAKKGDAETEPSVIQRKPTTAKTAVRTTAAPAPTRKVTTTRPTVTAKPLVIQDAVSLTRDLQAALRDAASSPSNDGVVSSDAVSSKSPSGSEIDVLGRYLDRALVLSNGTSKSSKAAAASTNSKNDLKTAEPSPSDVTSPTSRTKAASEKRQEIVLAKHVINAGLKTLLNIYNSGYRFPAQTSTALSAEKKSAWKDADVTKVVDACWQAFQTIDRLEPGLGNESRTETPVEADEASGEKAEESNQVVDPEDAQASERARNAMLEMEKIRTVLVSRCWMLGMYNKCLDILAASQTRILRLYDHDISTSLPTALTDAQSRANVIAVQRKPQAKAASRGLVANPFSNQPQVLQEWVTLLDYPVPSPSGIDSQEKGRRGMAGLNQVLKSVMIGRLVAAWISICGVSAAAKNADLILQYLRKHLNGCPPEKFGVLELATDSPEIAKIQHTFQIYVALNKVEVALPQLKQVVSVQTMKTSALAICASEELKGSSPGSISFDKLWVALRTSCTRCITGAEREMDILQAAGEMIRTTIGVFTRSRDQPEHEKGMSGPEWFALLEFWLELGRSLNDIRIIEEASDYLAKREPCRESSEGDLENQMSSLSLGKEDAMSNIRRIIVDFTRLAVRLERTPFTSDVCASLRDTSKQLQTISRSLKSLPADEYPEAVIKISRTLRGLQHRIEKASERRASNTEASAEWDTAFDQWMLSLGPCISDILAEEAMATVPVKYQVDLAVIAIQAAFDLSKRLLKVPDFSSHAISLGVLDKARALVASCQAPPEDELDWLVLLSTAYYNRGVSLYLGELPVPALLFIERSVDIVKEILQESRTTDDRNTDKLSVLEELRVQHSKRLELLAACYIKKGEKMNGLATYFACLMSQDQAVIDQITRTAEKFPPSQAVKLLPSIVTLLNRLASYMQKEALFFTNNPAEVERQLTEWKGSDAYKGTVLEFLLDCLADAAHRREIASLTRQICHALTSIYTSERYPLRRLRVQVRLMDINVNSGFEDWDIAAAKAVIVDTDADRETSASFDQDLVKYRPQYVAQGHLHLALASQRSPSTTANFTLHAEQAVSLLSTLISRPSKKAAVSSIAQKQKRIARISAESSSVTLDDPLKLDQQLHNLGNNLGIFSHGLHRIEILRLRRGLQRLAPELKGAYLKTTSQLALEYARLGKHKRAGALFNVTRASIDKSEYRNSLSKTDLAEISLRYASYLAWAGDAEKSIEIYEQARRQYQVPQEKNAPSATAKIRAKADSMNLVAMSNALLADIAVLKNDIASATRHGAIAFRLWNRAVDNLARIAVKSQAGGKPSVRPQVILDDPFVAPRQPGAAHPQDAPPLDEEQGKRTMAASTRETRLSGNHLTYTWSLLESTLSLAQTHLTKGSAKQAEAYATQAYDLASELRADIWKAKASSMLAAVYVKTESLEQASKYLGEAKSILDKMNSSESAVCALWLNRLHTKKLQDDEAEEAFQSLLTIIGSIEVSLAEVERVASTPIKHSAKSRVQSVVVATAEDPALSIIRTQGMRQRARQLRLAGNIAEGETLLEQCLAADPGHALMPEYEHIMGYLLMSKVLNHFKTDLFLNSVTESSISMPMGGFITEGDPLERQSSIDVMSILVDAETAFQRFLAARGQTGNVEDVRDAVMSVALLKVYQSSLGQSSSALTFDTVDLLDKSCALTLHREMLELLDSKRFGKSDELNWPASDLHLAMVPNAESARVTESDAVDGSSPSRHRITEGVALQRRFECFTTMEENTGKTLTQSLPEGWSVVTINLTDDQNTLFISRQQGNREPLVFAVALNRQCKKEDDEDEQFTFQTATSELRDIIQSSDDTARNAKNIDTRDGRIEWWNTRKALDKRLESLLREIEYSWLGAFKTILNPVDGRSPASLSTFKTSLERIFRNALSRQDKAKVNRVRLQTSIIECFSSLSCKSDEQEIEDLVYYLLDLYLYNGVPVALAELDIEQLVIDVQSALSTFESDRRSESVLAQPEEHIFLVLDKHVQEIPWESLPILRGRAINRIPSARFLFERLDTHTASRQPPDENEDAVPQKQFVDVSNTCFILNAAGDLKQTQGRFGSWLNDMTESRGWKGIVNRHPTEMELAALLERHNLLLYFGHGGMEQYIRSQKIRSLKTCATAMLWGCSSGILKYMGELDRTGTPHNYMLAGCPSLTAMLWDVTDKDIDKMAEAVMQDLGLMPKVDVDGVEAVPTQSKKPKSIAQAVGAARDHCKLKYLTGAAAVTYGIPMYF